MKDEVKRNPVYNERISKKQDKPIGERLSDKVAKVYGSWKFILTVSSVFLLWIIWNSVQFLPHFDPFPFILLNLFLSFIAGYTGSFLQMSANRQAARDRDIFEHNYEISKLAETENQHIQKDIDEIKSVLKGDFKGPETLDPGAVDNHLQADSATCISKNTTRPQA